ncbi:glycosyl transferases group 1 [Lucifera butyrica]|uniref:3-deoxy-D-manno-octulosonic acid transferase n=1 Tax=Lucifera butyrica TaxID=1351585 RepID=A0A498RCK8_9FIRM|nr:3-deoxy-D-manno-octulosonic acid transferase [Lucifera butyrica]VBB09274.1 glycosyl transferases group 1 [Lucifera butyrica]
MQFVYNLVAIILVVLALPVFIVRLIREVGFGERLRQSFGFLRNEDLRPVARQNCVWLHAASVGEIVATSPILKELKRRMPDVPVMVSVVTATGYAMAKRIMPEADSIIFFPLDLPWLGISVIRRIRPGVFAMVETELWPNFLRAARSYRIPVVMVNGRISDKSVKRYRHLGRILQDMLDTITWFCMQSSIDAEYIVRLGADPSRVIITGNTKFDQTYTAVGEPEKKRLQSEFGLTGSFPILVAGSTHKGEEEAVLETFNKIKETYPAAKLILAPRDYLRVEEIQTLSEQAGLSAVRRTALNGQPDSKHDVVLLDTIGELGKIYSLGDIIFVGGSLVPTGGHNILEPAAHGKPILVGPHMFNFKETYALMSGKEACDTVQDAAELTEKTLFILEHEELRRQMGTNALRVIEDNRGAAGKSVSYIEAVYRKQANP